MSYDIEIGDREFNYTYNLARFFHTFIRDEIGTTGLQALHGKKGKEAAALLGEAFEEIGQNFYDEERGYFGFAAAYDPENGWGDTYGATLLLGKLLAACAANRKSIVILS